MRILERGDQQQTTRGVIAGAAVVGQCHKSSAVKKSDDKTFAQWRREREREGSRVSGEIVIKDMLHMSRELH